MKNPSKLVLILVAAFHLGLAHSDAPPPAAALKPTVAEAQATIWSARILERYHYKPVALDEAMGDKILARYLKSLDPERLLFTAADVQRFAQLRPRLSEAIPAGDLSVPFAMFDVYRRRFDERFAYSRTLLKSPMDFTLNESLQPVREKANWPDSDAALRDLWRQRVKNDWLRLKLAGKDDKGIRETLDKRYDSYISRAHKTDSEDVFQIFMDAYTTSIEPHTDYFGPRVAEAFDFSMRLSLDGIGCTLQTREDYTVIRDIVPGSPAAGSGRLHVGDRIVGVAQGTDAPFVEVIGWRIDDVVAIIRGEKKSTVRLDILPAAAGPDGKHMTVTLVRNTISMAKQSAAKSIVDVGQGAAKRRVGVITLPAFYQDFQGRGKGDKQFKSASRDVAALLAQLKKAKVDTVLIDLRDNGGGSLDEAVQLTGLFIDQGPVVQQRNAEGQVQVESDTKPGLAWDGPLGVLINRGSASASEIFAAAIQDYGRGLILGETSFGKGTVQTVIGLDRFGQGDKPRMGELKMTIAQFFRINGGTTQLRGVTPDITLLNTSDDEEFGESSYDNALPWTSLTRLPYVRAGELATVVPLLEKQHAARVAKDREYRFLADDIALLRKMRKDNQLSLNEQVRRKERDAEDARMKSREKPSEAKRRADDGLQGDERSLASEIAAEEAAKNAKDVLLDEATHVLADEVTLLKTDPRLAADILPYKHARQAGANVAVVPKP